MQTETRDADTAADEPGDARQHTEHGRERRQQLLDAAAELFAEHGYANTRIIDICSRAGVAKGLFYWYFPTKAALFADLVHTMRQRLRRAQAAAFPDGADARVRITRGAAASVRFMADHAAYFTLLDVERSHRDVAEILADGSNVYFDDAIRLVEEGQRTGVISASSDPSAMAVGVLGSVSTFSNAYRNGLLRPGMTVDELADIVARWVDDALG